MHVSFSQKWIGPLFLTSMLMTSCSPWGRTNQRKPPLFIIAVESLGFENASCLEESLSGELDGIQELCDSALRFTHFYAPSTMSQSSMASLLTGAEVAEHTVFHNGNDGISVQLVTLAEKALLAGYRTAFFSGGPPFLAKSGFQQGYEVFDDDFDTKPHDYTPASALLERAFSWIQDQHRQPTMTTVFLADLQFPFVQTYTDEKKEREKSVAGQKQAVSEALGEFFRQLKKNRLWDNSYIVVVGLNGEAPMNRKAFLWRENLFRENVHVPLFIKTPQLREARSIDFLISMKNIGQLLRDSLEQSLSVADFVMQKLDEWKEAPPSHLEIRSDWGVWWLDRPPLLSFRTSEYLAIPQKRLQVYHSLVDKNEGVMLSEQQIDREKIRWLKSRIERSYDLQVKPSESYDFLKVLRTIKMSGTPHLVRDLDRKEKSNYSEAMAMDEALRRQNWNRLKDSSQSLHRYVASRHLQSSMAVTLSGACERFFVEKPRESLFRRCRDALFISLLDWERHRSKDTEDLSWEKNFVRQFRSFMNAKQMAYLNLYLELNWDVNVFPMLGPSLTELYLQLPEKASLRKKVESYKMPLTTGFPVGDI